MGERKTERKRNRFFPVEKVTCVVGWRSTRNPPASPTRAGERGRKRGGLTYPTEKERIVKRGGERLAAGGREEAEQRSAVKRDARRAGGRRGTENGRGTILERLDSRIVCTSIMPGPSESERQRREGEITSSRAQGKDWGWR